jgi:adenine-specific DNA-methyltransferase
MGIEKKRLVLEKKLASAKNQEERNILGQFATPPKLASDILKTAKKLFPASSEISFIDPAFGTGPFFEALLKVFGSERIEKAVGYEIDSEYGEPVKELWKGSALNLHIEDFTKATPPKGENNKFNLVVCNPPYVRHHHIKNGGKERLKKLIQKRYGIEMSGLAGLYCYFLMLSVGWMKKGGIGAWLIPSEFMDVNYGEALKSFLLNKVSLLHIHRFSPDDVQFADALVSSTVVWFQNIRPSKSEYEVSFSFGGTLQKPVLEKTISTAVLRNEPKWTRFPMNGIRNHDSGQATLGNFFTIRRGIATGDNSFFILTADEIKSRKLPAEVFRPILPSPRFLNVDEVHSDKKGNPQIDRKLFLLDCSLKEEDIKQKYPALWRYLEEGRGKGVCDRFLCKNKRLWYQQEFRPEAPIFCTYIGRSNNKKKQNRKTFRFILNHSQATVTNSYLILYPKGKIKERPELLKKVWEALNKISQSQIMEEGRVYGGGMHKVEPKELARVPTDAIKDILK